MTNQDFIIINRPRRWGKSLNLTMLYSFLTPFDKDNNKKLFEHLYINESEYDDFRQ